jgi:hypothetical protein
MKKFSVILVILLLSFVQVFTQVVVPDKDRPTELDRSVFGLGASISVGTGIGISFRHHLPSIMSYQITAGIIKDSRNLLYDIGAEVQIDLVRGETTRFYGGGGIGYFYKGENSNDLKGPFRVATGIGLETKVRESLHFSGSLYFTYFTNGQILPLPSVGMHYYFF